MSESYDRFLQHKIREQLQWMHDNEGDDVTEQDALDHLLQECGQTDDDGCHLAGSEYGDFECPFRDGLFGEEDATPDAAAAARTSATRGAVRGAAVKPARRQTACSRQSGGTPARGATHRGRASKHLRDQDRQFVQMLPAQAHHPAKGAMPGAGCPEDHVELLVCPLAVERTHLAELGIPAVFDADVQHHRS